MRTAYVLVEQILAGDAPASVAQSVLYETEVARTGSAYIHANHNNRKTRRWLKIRIADHRPSASAQAVHGENDLYVWGLFSVGNALGWLAAEANLDPGRVRGLPSAVMQGVKSGFDEWKYEKKSEVQQARWDKEREVRHADRQKRYEENRRVEALDIFRGIGRRGVESLLHLIDEYDAALANPEYGQKRRKSVRREILAQIKGELKGKWSRYWKPPSREVYELKADLDRWGSEV